MTRQRKSDRYGMKWVVLLPQRLCYTTRPENFPNSYIGLIGTSDR